MVNESDATGTINGTAAQQQLGCNAMATTATATTTSLDQSV